ncbi:hypothetical protein AtNW77_Chr2g0231221 [Arabidopsis thaliana]
MGGSETSTFKTLWTWNFGFFTNHVCRDLHLQGLMDMELWFLYKPCLQRPPPPRPYGYRTFTKFLR